MRKFPLYVNGEVHGSVIIDEKLIKQIENGSKFDLSFGLVQPMNALVEIGFVPKSFHVLKEV